MTKEELVVWRTIYQILVQTGYVEMYKKEIDEIDILVKLFYKLKEEVK